MNDSYPKKIKLKKKFIIQVLENIEDIFSKYGVVTLNVIMYLVTIFTLKSDLT